MFCKKCGKEIDDSAVTCVHCSAPVEAKPQKKTIFKRWWFWVIVVVVFIAAIGGASGSNDEKTPSGDNTPTQSTTDNPKDEVKKEIEYEVVDLQIMLDDLNDNALKAEKTYQDKYVEVTGQITNFDSDGAYISIEPVNADEWNFDTVMCKIKNDEQLDILLEKKTGDKVTIKGQVTSIGEVLGYTIKIAEVK